MKEEIKEVWIALGRDPKKLKIDGKTDEELEDILKKLKTIKYAFDMIFTTNPGVDLAVGLLRETFNIKDEE